MGGKGRTVLLCVLLIGFFFTMKPTDALISKFILVRTLHVSGSFSAHHQEFSTVHSALAHVIQV